MRVEGEGGGGGGGGGGGKRVGIPLLVGGSGDLPRGKI